MAVVLAVIFGLVFWWYSMHRPTPEIKPDKSDLEAGKNSLQAWDSYSKVEESAGNKEKFEYYATRTMGLAAAGDYQQAVESFNQTKQYGEPDSMLYMTIGSVYEQLGRKGEAAEAYRNAITAAEKAIQDPDIKRRTIQNIQKRLEGVS